MPSVRIRTLLRVLAALYLAYVALVLVVCVPLLNLLAPGIYRDQTGRELRVDNILVNPFTLSVWVQHAAGANPDGTPFWSFDSLVADASVASLWHGYPVLDRLELSGLSLQVDQTAPQRYNFSDILDYRAAHAAPAQPAAAPEPGAPLRIAVHRIRLDARHLGLRAPYLTDPVDVAVRDLHIATDGLSTVPPTPPPPDALPSLAFDRFAVGIGHVQLRSLRQRDPFATHWQNLNASLEHFSTSVEPGQPYNLTITDESGGSLRWQGDLSLAARRASGALELRNVSLLPVWRYLKPQLAFTATGARFDAAGQYHLSWRKGFSYQVESGRVALRQVKLQANDDADTGVAWKNFSAAGIAVDGDKRSVAVAKVALDGLALRGSNQDTRVSLVDMFKIPDSGAPAPEPASATPPWQIAVADIAVGDSRVDWRASQLAVPALALTPFTLHVTDLHWPEPLPATLAFETTVNNDVQVAVDGTLVPDTLTGKLSGTLAGLPLSWGNTLLGQQMRATLADGKLGAQWQLQLAQGAPTSVQVDGAVDKLELRRQSDRRKLLAWKRLQWSKLALDLDKHRLAIARIDIAEPWAQFRINRDGTNNFQQLLVHQAQPAGDGHATAPAADSGKPWQIAIGEVRPRNGTLDFRDNSLARRFHAVIGNFSGHISGLDSGRDQAAKVDLKGSVDDYAPVSLTGTTNPFAAKPSLDLALDFSNLDLATLTPYSGTYAGFAIDRGQLSVQLAYQLHEGRIQGKNHIVVQQLQLGERVRSPKMVDLPLRLAIALLTDADGVMDLGVDISGNVDDPQFDLSSIIWKAFRNLIVKAATAPFRLLAGLVPGGGAKQLGQIDFAAGSAALSNGATGKLAQLKDALLQRPRLRLNISGHSDPAVDGPALQRRLLDRQLLEAGLSRDDIREQSRRWQRAIEERYRKQFPDLDPDKQTPQQQADAVSAALPLPPAQLTALAGQRALAVKRALVVDLGLPAERVFIDAGDARSQQQNVARVTMSLDG